MITAEQIPAVIRLTANPEFIGKEVFAMYGGHITVSAKEPSVVFLGRLTPSSRVQAWNAVVNFDATHSGVVSIEGWSNEEDYVAQKGADANTLDRAIPPKAQMPLDSHDPDSHEHVGEVSQDEL
jgi:hypothetical protein